jgi:cation transport regulator
MASTKKNLNPLLTWLWDMMSFYSTDEIRVPEGFHEQVKEVKKVLRSDVSGLVNSVLDFAINCATVDYTIETDNTQLTDLIETWFDTINMNLIGRVPTGIQALSKEYYRERWKNSSLLVLRTEWNNVDINGTTLNLPTKMWFVDGFNIKIEDDTDTRIIGEEKYFIRVNDKKFTPIPAKDEELLFIQKPYDSWGSLYSTPFLIQRGLYKNLRVYDLINTKSEKIIGKAMEYLLLLKKGTEQLALKGSSEFTYDEKDLENVKDNLKTLIQNAKTDKGTPSWVTNFDTELTHLIPEYKQILDQSLYVNIEKRLLAGLGLVEIIEGTTATRREGVLNPKPFIKETESGIEGFISLLEDIIKTIVDKNKQSHPKYFSDDNDIKLHYTPVRDFINDSVRDHLRSMYDRGVLSKQTYSEVIPGVDFDIEVKRRKQETKGKLDIVMYAPVTDNREGVGIDLPTDSEGQPKLKNILPKPPVQPSSTTKKNISVKKQGLEAKNFKGNEEPYDGTDTEFLEALEEFSKIYEEAPYSTNKDLPPAVRKYPSGAQTAFRKAWMSAFEHYKNETTAFKVAWTALKNYMKSHSGSEEEENIEEEDNE